MDDWDTSNSEYGRFRRVPIDWKDGRPSTNTRDDSLIARVLEQDRQSDVLNEAELTRDDSAIAVALSTELPSRDVSSRALLRRISSERGDAELLDPKTITVVPEPDVVDDHRARLYLHLQDFDLVEHVVKGDGACQFRSIAHQLYGDENRHDLVRDNVVQRLRAERDRYEPFVDDDYDDFLIRMAAQYEWGDHLTLQAAADVYQTRICLLTSYKDRPFVHVLPTNWTDEDAARGPTIWLSFWAEVHYNSLESIDGQPLAPII